jgi:hypothetical protein
MNYNFYDKLIILLLLLLFLFNYFALKEGFDNYSHSVDLPINTKYSCNNFCGPPATCSITGEQCTSDADCYGCKPILKTYNKKKINIMGYNDAGKLTDNQTPNFSVLTTDIGTQTYNFPDKINSPPPSYVHGVNTWRNIYDKGQMLYNKKYTPQTIINPEYNLRPSLSGEFIDNGPYAANSTL